jgi:hypothetical protein
MTARPSDWRRLYDLAQSEEDASTQSKLCDQARRLIQDRSIESAEANACNAAEEDELNAALRELWKLQNCP